MDDARAAGVAPLSRRTFGKDGKINSTLAPDADAVKAVAAEKHVAVLDLQAASIALWNKLGPDGCHALAPHKDGGDGYDGTHLNPKGSEVVGKILIDLLRQAVPQLAPDLKAS